MTATFTPEKPTFTRPRTKQDLTMRHLWHYYQRYYPVYYMRYYTAVEG